MPIELRCPSPTCRQKLRLPDSVAGRAFKCPRCKKAVIEAPAPVKEEVVEILADDAELVDIFAEDAGELAEVIEDADLVAAQDAGDELVEILPDDDDLVPRPRRSKKG